MTGKIKNLNERGFGFIVSDTAQPGDKEIFFHSENVVGTTFNELQPGQAVSFDIQSGPKGPFAANVTLLAEGEAAPMAPAASAAAPMAEAAPAGEAAQAA
jgi:CspA family cold shock protein